MYWNCEERLHVDHSWELKCCFFDSQAPNLDESSAQLQEQLAELKKYCPDEKPPAVPTATPKPADDLMAAAEQMVVSAKEVYSKNPQVIT